MTLYAEKGVGELLVEALLLTLCNRGHRGEGGDGASGYDTDGIS